MAYSSRCVKTAAFLLTFGLLPAGGQTLDQAASQLAPRIAAAIPAKSSLSLSVENLSSLTVPEVTKVRDAIQSALARAGLAIDSKALPLLEITISENARGLLLIARVPSTNGIQTVMVPWTVLTSTSALCLFRSDSSMLSV